MKKHLFPLAVIVVVILAACTSQQKDDKTTVEYSGKSKQAEVGKLPQSPPNVILFLADDMGWGDAGCYGQKDIQTPHLDKMAKNGIRFTQAYCGAPVCAPSRSTLMEGLHGGRTRVRNNRTMKKENIFFTDSTYTMADMFKEAGYATGLFGKWGLGNEGTEGIPTKQGFDEFYGFLDQRNAHHYYVDSLWHNDKKIPVALDTAINYASSDWYLDKAVDFIKEKAKSDKPFFAYVPTQLPHLYMPYTAMDKYKNKPWPEGDKRYATMISTIDAHMGRLNDLVDSLGIAENTLLIFLSDNGGGNGQRIFYHYVQFFKSNGNFRGMKRDLYEGGIRVPMIAQWKGVIPATSVSDEPVAYYDLMKTFADLANVELPKTDGASLVPLFTTEKDSIDRPYLYWEFPYMDIPNAKFAVRKGKWKGVKEYKNQPLQLYNIDEDPSEVFNWAKEYPEIITEMEAIIAKEHEPSTYWPMYDE